MVVVNFYHLLILLILPCVAFSARRITDGRDVTENKKYAVYFLKADKSDVEYTGWTCGGAIVTEWFIITAASCVEDVQYMYAIAGYKKFVTDKEIDVDQCTMSKKKKVILTCVPKNYKFSYNKIEDWARIDIAVVKVESPYNFEDSSYAKICSYTPAPIPVNYEPRYQQPGLDAMAMGWGHPQSWRNLPDLAVYNSETLKYAATRILAKDTCKKYYSEIKGLDEIIDDYMICTLDPGNLDDVGEVIERSKPGASGCLSKVEKLMGKPGPECELSSSEIIAVRAGIDADLNAMSAVGNRKDLLSGNRTIEKIEVENGTNTDARKWNRNYWNSYLSKVQRQNEPEANSGENQPDDTDRKDQGENSHETTISYQGGSSGEALTTKDDEPSVKDSTNQQITASLHANPTPGLCQNDHGSPLVSWIGTHEVLIGVGSVFKIDENMRCVGPYLFTSTQCNGRFIDCIINMNSNDTSLRRKCDQLLRRDGIHLIERRLSWIGHPAGPAENEMIQERAQIPLHQYHGGY